MTTDTDREIEKQIQKACAEVRLWYRYHEECGEASREADKASEQHRKLEQRLREVQSNIERVLSNGLSEIAVTVDDGHVVIVNVLQGGPVGTPKELKIQVVKPVGASE